MLLCFLCLWGPLLPAQHTLRRYLSGTDKDHTVPWAFHIDRGRNSGVWTTIPVPSNWELQGFGVYTYGRGDQPASDETATYRHRFDVPGDWRGRHIAIVFDGVMTDAEVWINDRPAGPVHQGGFYRFRYDIGHLLRYGRPNQLEVRVRNVSADASVNTAEREADYWLFGGIYRPVWLEVLPQAHIQWTAIDARHDGAFRLLAHSQHFADATHLEAQAETLDGQPLGQPLRTAIAAGDTTATVAGRYAGIAPWSAEFPQRYRVQVRLMRGETLLHTRRETFGFRSVELRPGDGLYVNGVRVLLKGVNRHSFWPTSGRCLSPEISILDVAAIKDMNMNAVRMSHYPPDDHFLDVCDSLGLYVLDELAGWQTMYDSVVGKKLVREMLVRDVNHPCIILWDNGNEGGSNPALDKEFHRYDPQRRQVIHPWKKQRDTDTQHYKDYGCCIDGLFGGERVFFPTEFLHGLYDGGHGAGLEDHWNLMRQHPLSAGGFLWALVDECVARRDRGDSLDCMGSAAPDGILGPFREREGSFYAIKEIWSPIHIPDMPRGFAGRVLVENRYHFTRLDQCRFAWAWGDFPAPGDTATGLRVWQSGSLPGPALAPGEAGWLALPLPEGWTDREALRLQAFDPQGRLVWTWVWPTKAPAAMVLPPPQGDTPQVRLGADAIEVLAGGVRYRFADGMIDGVQRGAQTFSLGRGPVMAGGAWTVDSTWWEAAPGVVRVHARAEQAHWTWQVRADGRLELDLHHLPQQGSYDVLGISFTYPEDQVQGVRYLGAGPYRVWKNRLRGTTTGVWEKAYNNTVTGESWDYPEFKGFHADLHWAELRTDEGAMRIFCQTPGLYLHLFTPERPRDAFNEHTTGVFPEGGNLSLLHAIGPIGTKFKEARQLGPQSQPNLLHYWGGFEPLRIQVWFEFGE
ncbi:MAG: glycoside hydrolase family 2 [Bacteroidia bacterium]